MDANLFVGVLPIASSSLSLATTAPPPPYRSPDLSRSPSEAAIVESMDTVTTPSRGTHAHAPPRSDSAVQASNSLVRSSRGQEDRSDVPEGFAQTSQASELATMSNSARKEPTRSSTGHANALTFTISLPHNRASHNIGSSQLSSHGSSPHKGDTHATDRSQQRLTTHTASCRLLDTPQSASYHSAMSDHDEDRERRHLLDHTSSKDLKGPDARNKQSTTKAPRGIMLYMSDESHLQHCNEHATTSAATNDPLVLASNSRSPLSPVMVPQSSAPSRVKPRRPSLSKEVRESGKAQCTAGTLPFATHDTAPPMRLLSPSASNLYARRQPRRLYNEHKAEVAAAVKEAAPEAQDNFQDHHRSAHVTNGQSSTSLLGMDRDIAAMLGPQSSPEVWQAGGMVMADQQTPIPSHSLPGRLPGEDLGAPSNHDRQDSAGYVVVDHPHEAVARQAKSPYVASESSATTTTGPAFYPPHDLQANPFATQDSLIDHPATRETIAMPQPIINGQPVGQAQETIPMQQPKVNGIPVSTHDGGANQSDAQHLQMPQSSVTHSSTHLASELHPAAPMSTPNVMNGFGPSLAPQEKQTSELSKRTQSVQKQDMKSQQQAASLRSHLPATDLTSSAVHGGPAWPETPASRTNYSTPGPGAGTPYTPGAQHDYFSRRHRAPPSHQYPFFPHMKSLVASPHSSHYAEWTQGAVQAIRDGLEWLPKKFLDELGKEELRELVLHAIHAQSDGGNGGPHIAQQALPPHRVVDRDTGTATSGDPFSSGQTGTASSQTRRPRPRTRRHSIDTTSGSINEPGSTRYFPPLWGAHALEPGPFAPPPPLPPSMMPSAPAPTWPMPYAGPHMTAAPASMPSFTPEVPPYASMLSMLPQPSLPPEANKLQAPTAEAMQTASTEEILPGAASMRGATSSAHDWFVASTGRPLPDGWRAEFDNSTQKWYYVNMNTQPPTTMWMDSSEGPFAAKNAPLNTPPSPDHSQGAESRHIPGEQAAQEHFSTMPSPSSTASVETPSTANGHMPQMPGGLPLHESTAQVYPHGQPGDGTYATPQHNPFAMQLAHQQPPQPDSWQVPPIGQPYDPATARAYADWHASRFGAFEAHRQHTFGRKGPVAAELDSERKRVQQLRRAQSLADEATVRLNDLGDRDDRAAMKERTLAEEQMARAQGVIDRLRYEDEVRRNAIPPELEHYAGITRGFEYPGGAPRTDFVDARPARGRSASYAPMMDPPVDYDEPRGRHRHTSSTASVFSLTKLLDRTHLHRTSSHQSRRGRSHHRSHSFDDDYASPSLAAAAASLGQADYMAMTAANQNPYGMLPRRMPPGMPTAAPLPSSSMRYRGSNVPTPYGMPEVCFTWDMLLRTTLATEKISARPPPPPMPPRSFSSFMGAGSPGSGMYPPGAPYAGFLPPPHGPAMASAIFGGGPPYAQPGMPAF